MFNKHFNTVILNLQLSNLHPRYQISALVYL